MDCWTISVTQNMRAPIRRIFRLRLMDGRVYFWFGGAFFLSFSCPAHQLGDKKKERKKKKLQIPASWKPWKRSWVHAWWGGTCWRSAHSWWPSICIFRLGPFLTGCKREEKKEDDKYTDVGPTRPSARKSVSGSDDLRKMNGLKLKKKAKFPFFPIRDCDQFQSCQQHLICMRQMRPIRPAEPTASLRMGFQLRQKKTLK